MELARLAIVLAIDAARKAARDLNADLERIGTTANRVGISASVAINAMGNQSATRGIQQLEKSVASLGKEIEKMSASASAASASLSGTGGARAGGGFANSAAAATFSVATLEKAVVRLAAQFLTLQAGLRLIKASVEVQIEFENLRNILTLVTGSAAEASQQFRFLQTESDRIGISFRETAGRFARFEAAARTSGISADQLKETFIAVAEAGRRFGLSASDQGRVMLALEQMVSKGVVSMEELRRQLGEAIPGAFSIAARAMQMSERDFNKLVESGKLATVDFLGPFTRELAKVAPAGESVASTAAELLRLKNAWDRFLASNGIATPVRFAARQATAGLIGLQAAFEGPQNTAASLFQDTLVEPLRRTFTSAFTGIGAAIAGPQQRAPSDALLEGLEKVRKMRQQVELETLDGYERERREIQITTQKHLDELKKVLDALDPVKDKGEFKKFVESGGLMALDEITNARDVAIKRLDQKKFIEDLEKSAEATKKLNDMTTRLTIEGMEPLEAATAKVHQAFESDLLDLFMLEQQGLDTAKTYEALVKSRDKMLRDVAGKRQRLAFRDESIAELRGGIRRGERGLLTEDDAEEFTRISQRIQDRSAELARRLKADAVTVREAWSIGWEQQVKQFGSFSERVAQTGAGLADTLDRNFTDAFAGMITGAKSAGDAFREMTASILSDLARLAVRQFIVGPALQSFGGAFGLGGAGAPAGVGTAVPVGAGAGAAIGFSEFSRSVNRVAAAVGNQKAPNVTIINTSNPKEFEEQIAANPDAVVNALSRRASTVRRMIG